MALKLFTMLSFTKELKNPTEESVQARPHEVTAPMEITRDYCANGDRKKLLGCVPIVIRIR